MGTTIHIKSEEGNFSREINSNHDAGLYLKIIYNTFNWESTVLNTCIKKTAKGNYKIKAKGIASIIWVIDHYLLDDPYRNKALDCYIYKLSDEVQAVYNKLKEDHSVKDINICRQLFIEMLCDISIYDSKYIKFTIL